MADYRELLERYQKEEILKKFTQHIHDYGGLFSSEARQNILGINPKNANPFEDKAKNWSNIKKSIRNGFVDIQLVSKIASSNQLRKIFEHVPDYPQQKFGGVVPDEFVNTVSPNLISAIDSILNSGDKSDIKQQKWKSDLVYRIIEECLDYFLDHKLIRSPVHERRLREVTTIINAELDR